MWGIYISIDRLIVGLTGISSSGKSTLAELLGEALIEFTDLRVRDVTVLHLDNFYRPIDEVYDIQGLIKKDSIDKVNWDDPNLIDYERLIGAITELKEKGKTTIKKYDKLTGTYPGETETIVADRVIIVESFLLFSSGIPIEGKYSSGKYRKTVLANQQETSRQILELIPYRVFVDCQEDVAWVRRVGRDAHFVPRTFNQTDQLWTRDAWPAAQNYIYPIKKLKSEGGIFDRLLDNTTLNVVDIDYLLWDILAKAHISIKPEYGHDFNPRREWIEKKYSSSVIKEAEMIRRLFTSRNGCN